MKIVFAIAALAGALPAQTLSLDGPDPGVVRLGDSAALTVIVEGARDALELAPLPIVPGLDATIGRRVDGTTRVLVDGVMVDAPRSTWRITLEPSADGEFELPPIEVLAGAATLRSRAIQLECVRDAVGTEHAFVEVSTDRDSYFVMQPIEVTVRFGFDQELVNDRFVQLYRQHLDLPVHMRARWLEDLAGTISEPRAAPTGRLSTAFNGERVRIDTEAIDRAGKRVLVHTVRQTFWPTHADELVIPPALARFSWAAEFRDDLIRGRVATDRREAIVASESITVDVLPLPDADRPQGFRGAVGAFSVRATADRTEVAVGEPIRLELRIQGEGNHGYFELPQLALVGFHSFGSIRAEGSTHEFEIAPTAIDVREIPSIEFAFLDPTPPGRYRTARTEPIPVTVRPPTDAAATGTLTLPARTPGEDDIYDVRTVGFSDARNAPSPTMFAIALVLPWLIALGLHWWRRARDRALADPAGLRARRAAHTFRRNAHRDSGAAFVEFIAAHLRCSPAAVVAGDLAQRLSAAGLAEPRASHIAALVDAHVDARFGGAEAPLERTQLDRLVADTHAELTTSRSEVAA